MNILDNAFTMHETSLKVRTQRLETLAKNIANSETPHFKAQDLDFKSVYKNVANKEMRGMATTNAKHFPIDEGPSTAEALKYRIPFNASVDGNTVEISVEQAQYGKAAADYRASMMFTENTTSGIKRALRGE